MKKFIWLLVSLLMVVSLVLASCGEAVTEEEEAVAEEEEEEVVTEGPKYGGKLNLAFTFDSGVFDTLTSPSAGKTENLNVHMLDSLCMPDRLRGPGGTGEFTGMARGLPPDVSLKVGFLAESWEIVDTDTVRFHMRPELINGEIRWHDKPPANGRAMTVDDIIYNIKRLYELPTSYPGRAYSHIAEVTGRADGEVTENAVFASLDGTAIDLVCLPGKAAFVHDMVTLYMSLHCPDQIEQDGDSNNWRNFCGTGPFMLDDYVSGSYIRYERNPDYWWYDPLYPENQLPYLDQVEVSIIEDLSTRLAALRTGQIDILNIIEKDDADDLMASNSEILYNKYPSMEGLWLFVRNDTAPFDDINVRRALMLAINQEEILDEFYEGDGILLDAPAPQVKVLVGYIPALDDLPYETAKLWEYHPDEAEQLLDAAGLPGPDRFSIDVVLWNDQQSDLLSIIADYLDDVGITVTQDRKEYTVWYSMSREQSYDQAIMAHRAGYIEALKYLHTRYGKPVAYACVPASDTLPEELYEANMAEYFNPTERAKVVYDGCFDYLAQTYAIYLPSPNVYHLWQPWVGGYHGELGWPDSYHRFTRYIWVDEDLK